MVNFEDVIHHTLSNLEDAARKDNAKLCKSLIQNLVREILEEKNNRRVAVEKGVVQSIIVIMKQFSFDGSEKRDQGTRLQLIGTCLEILLDLKAFVKLDENEYVPICILLRTYGVHVVLNSMVMHWSLKSRSTALFAQSLRVLYNIGTSEQGTRMLLDAQVHGILMGILEKDKIVDRDILLLMLRVLSVIVVSQSTARTLFSRLSSGGVSRIKLLLGCANLIQQDDFAYHKEVTSILCMVSTKREGAKAILEFEGSLGYIVQILHGASSTSSSYSQGTPLSPTSGGTRGGENLIELENNNASSSSGGSQLLSSEAINNTVQSAVSAGSNLFNNFIRRQGNTQSQQQQQQNQQQQQQNQQQQSQQQQQQQQQQGDVYNDDGLSKSSPSVFDMKIGDARRAACWTSMLLHNLCVHSAQDVQMRMVVAQAYETSNAALGTSFDRPIFQRILESVQSICMGNVPNEDDDDTQDLLIFEDDNNNNLSMLSNNGKSNLPLLEQIVENIVAGEPFVAGKDDDYCARAILMNIDYVSGEYVSESARLTLTSLLKLLLERFTKMLTERSDDGVPIPLPISTEGSRVLSFLLMLLGHPVLQRKLMDEPNALKVIIGGGYGSNDDGLSFLGMLRSMGYPEFSSAIERNFQGVVDFKSRQVKVFPLLPYRSFLQTRETTVTLGRQSSLDHGLDSAVAALNPVSVPTISTQIASGTNVKVQESPASASSKKGKLKSPTGSTVSSPRSPQGPGRFERSHTVAGSSPPPPGQSSSSSSGSSSRRSFGSMKGARTTNSARELRRNSYIPSHSNIILSPLLYDMNKKEKMDSESMEDVPTPRTESNTDGESEEGGQNLSQSAPNSMGPPSAFMPGSAGSFGSLFTNNFAGEEPTVSLFEWCDRAREVAIQISLRLERLYMAIDPCRLILLAAKGPSEQCKDELRFLFECDKLVYFFKTEVLEGETPWIRARIVECLIEVANCAASATLRNASLVVCCLEALSSSPIRRLELTWRNVSHEKYQVYEEIKTLCGFEEGNSLDSPRTGGGSMMKSASLSDDGTEDQEDFLRPLPITLTPTSFLSGARLPYVAGLLMALRSCRMKHVMNIVHPLNSSTISSSSRPPELVPKKQQTTALDDGHHPQQQDQEQVKKKPEGELTKSMVEDNDDVGNGDEKDEFDPLGLFSQSDLSLVPRPSSPLGLSPDATHNIFPSSDDDEDGYDDFMSPNGNGGRRSVDFVLLQMQYQVLARWISTTRSNGDWFQRVYSHQPNVHLQIGLKGLQPRPSIAEEKKMEQISLRQEPPWSLEQMLLESLYAIEAWIESLFDSDTEEEGKVIRAFRASIRNLDSSTSMDSASFLSDLSAKANSTTSNAAIRFRALGETANAAAQIFRSNITENASSGPGGTGNYPNNAATIQGDNTSSVSAATASTASATASNGGPTSSAAARNIQIQISGKPSALHKLPKIPPGATGKLINSLVRKISGARRERLLQESGSRSAEHWDKIVDHVRLCVERVVLAPILSRLLLGAMQEHIEKECALQERVLILQKVPFPSLVDILGLPKRNDMDQCTWDGAVATLRSMDDVDMPSLKLKILLRLKDEIYQEAMRQSVMDMNADEFLPVMTYVIVKAGLQHAYATTMLLRELLNDEFVSGEAAYYLTTFEIALGHLLAMDLPSNIVNLE